MKTDPLFELLASLGKQEKRYVRVALDGKNAPSDRQFSRLFRAFCNSPDGKDIRGQFRETSLYASYPVIKHQLYHRVLDVLREFHHHQFPEKAITDGMINLSILFDKKLYNQCTALLRSLQKKAANARHALYTAELLAWELRLHHAKSETDALKEKMYSTREKQSTLLRAQDQVYALQQVTYEGFTQLRENWLMKEGKENVLQALDKITPGTLLSDAAKVLYYQTRSTVLFSVNRKEEAFALLEEMIALLESDPGLKAHYVNQYIATLNNMNLLLLQRNEYARVLENIARLKTVRPATIEKQVRLHERLLTVEMNVYLETGDLAAAAAQLPHMHALLGGNRLGIVYRLLFHLLEFRFHFMSRDFRSALRVLAGFSSIPATGIRPDVYRAVSLLELIVHYELGNEDFIRTLCRRLASRKKEKPDSVQELFLGFFNRLTGEALFPRRRALFSEFEKQLAAPEMEKLWKENYLGNFDFTGWIKTHSA